MGEQKTSRKIGVKTLSRVAQILKTISHPVRLEILEILEIEEPLSVSIIQSRLSAEVEQSMLSHHLIKMKDKGILASIKNGKSIYYSLADRQLLKIFECMASCDLIK